ncbi:DedA family protein [Pseudooceanicola sp. 216_PA32_1]|uniref:DedA family protein n=1 Tax=Pseudooceanicola pacificus TaxID=2676438 RepID=A0A844WE76_9RHOB|nr:DedA family protein [Pseudooceanicola pacificus]MWB78862.1 DedA family protein [Pseudooceanicola pacificus]
MTEPADGTLALKTMEKAAEFEAWLPMALAAHGPSLMFLLCGLSCLALPVPASLAMLIAGAIAATGDAELWQLAVASFLGAITGDQIAYFVGRAGRGPLIRWLDRAPKRRDARLRAEDWTRRRGGPGVLLSRWPISPLGPYVNFAAGAAGLGWSRFAAWGIPGEAVWVGINLGLGYLFADQIAHVAMLAHEVAGLVILMLALIGLGIWRARRRAGQLRDSEG